MSEELKRQLNTPWEELTQEERDGWNAIEAAGIGASPTPEGRGGERDLTLRQAAERLLELGSKIDRAASEDEENRLCDERDKILSMMRKADALLSSPRVERERKMREALDRMVEHFGEWAKDRAHEATTETWAALHCAKAALSLQVE